MSTKTKITYEDVRAMYTYDPEEGVLRWKVWPKNGRKIGDKVGSVNQYGYLCTYSKRNPYLVHRVVWLWLYKEWPKDQIDHINHDRTDNRSCNLRRVSNRENTMNRKLRAGNKTGHTGVRKSGSKWLAQIKVNYKHIHLGTYGDFFEAVCARRSAENRYGFHPNHGIAKQAITTIKESD